MKRRPYLILTRQAGVNVLTSLVAVPATTNIRNIPSEVMLTKQDGMSQPCVLSLDNISTIDRHHAVERITTLDESKMAEVCEALRFVIDC